MTPDASIKNQPDHAKTKEPDVFDIHAELHHYTDWPGIAGILGSNQLWATHYSHLNDRTEVLHLREYLTQILAQRAAPYLQQLRKTRGMRFRRLLSDVGGIRALALSEAGKVVDTFYQVTFAGGRLSVPFIDPYVISFCGHSNDDDYVQANGLLSQWRGYGNDAGFAVVFDTMGLHELLHRENATYAYPVLEFCDVVYGSDLREIDERFAPLGEILESLLRDFAEEKRGEVNPETAFAPFVRAAIRLKHQGFKEEREVRIVASPETAAFRAELRRREPSYQARTGKLKTIHMRGANNSIGYLSLFDFEAHKASLPIKRIIVGPHQDQAAQEALIRGIVGRRYPIARSETPFLPRQGRLN